MTEHLGDSGRASSPSSCSRAGTADTPSIHLQQQQTQSVLLAEGLQAAAPDTHLQVPGTDVNAQSERYATNWPKVMANTCSSSAIRSALAERHYMSRTRTCIERDKRRSYVLSCALSYEDRGHTRGQSHTETNQNATCLHNAFTFIPHFCRS